MLQVADIYFQVVKNFGMELKNYKKMWNIYLCNTDQGLKILQPVRGQEGRIWFQHSTKEHLYRQGFKQISRFYLSAQETPYYTYNRQRYVLEDWEDGEELDYTDFESIQQVTELLGSFHQASKGMCPFKEADIVSYYSIFPNQMEKRTMELHRFRKRVYEHRRLSDFDLLLIRYYSYYYGLALESLTLLEQGPCQVVMNTLKKAHYVCHGDFTHHNVRKTEKGWRISDFSLCSYHIPIYEFTRFVNKTMRKSQWSVERALKMFEIYKQYIYESKGMEQLFLSLLMFPEEFWKLCNLYYNQRRTYPSKKYLEKMQELIETQEEHQQFLKEMKKHLL